MSAVDIIAIRQPDGSIKCTPFYVLLDSKKSQETIHVEVNGEVCHDSTMVATSNGDVGFSAPTPPVVESKKMGIVDILSFEKMIEPELAKQEGHSELGIEKKILEEEREIRLEIEEEREMFRNCKSGLISPNNSSESISKVRPPRTVSQDSLQVKSLSPIAHSLSTNNLSKSVSRNGSSKSINRNGSFSGSPHEWEVNEEPKIPSPKTPTKNRSLNSLLSPLLSLRKNGNNNGNTTNGSTTTNGSKQEGKTEQIVSTKQPTSEQLKKMKLKEGENTIRFVAKQSGQVAEARIFFWNYDTKVIVSDIDGTITKTDKRGLFYYKFGYDWTHEKVIDFYNALHKNGYKFVYLTARSVRVQVSTRSYLEKIKAPNGPILSAPHNFFGCVKTEYWKATAENKLSHLKPLKNLFLEKNIVAGFGNRVHDHVCYSAIEIPSERIYIINKQSEITVNGVKTTYDTLLQVAPVLFPPTALQVN